MAKMADNDGIHITLVDEDELAGDERPDTDVRLTFTGTLHNPAGPQPRQAVEVRISSSELAGLMAQGRAVQTALTVRRSRTARQVEAIKQAAGEVFRGNARTDLQTIQQVIRGLQNLPVAPTEQGTTSQLESAMTGCQLPLQ